MSQRMASLIKILPRHLSRLSNVRTFRTTVPSASWSTSLLAPSSSILTKNLNFRMFSSSSADDQLEKDFQSAVANLQKVSSTVDDEKKIKLYALYKQGTAGVCSEGKPTVFKSDDKFKWQAWKSLGEMTKDDAKKEYITIVKILLEAAPPELAKKEPEVVFEKRNQVYWIRLNRPKKYNAITVEMYEIFSDTLKCVADDPDVKFVVITGNGPYFSSGNDLQNFTRMAQLYQDDLPKGLQVSRDRCQDFVAAFIDFPKPLIGVVNGPCFGIMFTTLGLYDCVIASDTASFVCPFSSLGQSPEGCSTYTFPRIFGNSLASELLYFNYKMPVEEAHRLGFVSRIVPAGQLESHVEEWLYGSNGLVETCYPNSMFNAKALVRTEEDRLKLHAVNKIECDVLQQSWTSQECQEALMKFYSRK